MITKKQFKIFLSFLSLVAFISCSAGDKLGSETQSSQTVSGEGKGGLKTNLPIWGKGHKSELVGTWMRVWTDSPYNVFNSLNLSIDDNGNITLYISGRSTYDYLHNYTYTGKIEDNFEYPYTVNLTQTSFYYDGKLNTDAYYNGHTGTITFNNASNCSVKAPMYSGYAYRWFTVEELQHHEFLFAKK